MSTMRILFCVNWGVDLSCTDAQASVRFSPDYRIAGRPYWFFRHLRAPIEVDVMDFRVPFGTQNLELALTRCLWTQGLAAYLRSRRYDVVLSHGGQSGLFFALLQSLCRGRRVPHVLFDISRITGRSTKPLLLAACRKAVESVTATIAHSSHHLDFYRQHFPSIARNAHFIPLGVDTEEFAPRRSVIQDQIICVGYSKRDWPLLVDAYAALKTETKLVLLGIPESKRIARRGVECVPRVSIEEMRARISKSRFLVLPLPPCEYCIGQQTFLQTMALGKTALVADIPAVLDYIKDGENGFLYKTGDTYDLRCKLEYLLKTPDAVEKAGVAAREQVVRNFSEATMAQRVFDLLEQVV